MEFNTREFEFAHGRKPRGEGMWAFSVVRNPQPEQIFMTHGSFGEAKKAARQHFKGAFEVFVLS